MLARCHVNFGECGIEIRSFYLLDVLFDDGEAFGERLQDFDDFN